MKMIDVGEKAFLRGLLPELNQDKNFINGFGNDASVVDIGLADIAIAFKIDRAAKPIASYRGWAGFEVWGRLAVTANVSDILAVGAQPTAFMLSISVPAEWEVRHVREIVTGASEACAALNVAFVGGDTKEAGEAHVVGAAIGVVSKQNVISRKSAKSGDAVVLAGDLGGFAGAYLLRTNQLASREELGSKCLTYPQCAFEEAKYLFENYSVSSSVDLSDGLAEGLELLVADDAGVLVNLDTLPLNDAALKVSNALSLDPLNFAFTVGDWGMLFTMPEADALRAVAEAPSGLKLKVIGAVVDASSGGFFSASSGDRFKLNRSLTNEHFRIRMESEGSYFSDLVSSTLLDRIA